MKVPPQQPLRSRRSRLSRIDRRAQVWTMVGGIVVSTILFWVMVQLGQASSESKQKVSPASAQEGMQMASPSALEQTGQSSDDISMLAPPAIQGPAIEVPREVLGLLEQRKRELDRREENVRQHEGRLLMVKNEVEKLLDKNEALEKRIQTLKAKESQPGTPSQPTQRAKAILDKERMMQEQRTQLAKIYESMPSEDAAARLERMPDRKAIEILRIVKTKTAGAILAQVKADRAAKLTEQLLVHEQ